MNKYFAYFLVISSSLIIHSLCESQVYRCASELGIEGLCYKMIHKGSDNTVYVGGCPEGEFCPSSPGKAY